MVLVMEAWLVVLLCDPSAERVISGVVFLRLCWLLLVLKGLQCGESCSHLPYLCEVVVW